MHMNRWSSELIKTDNIIKVRKLATAQVPELCYNWDEKNIIYMCNFLKMHSLETEEAYGNFRA